MLQIRAAQFQAFREHAEKEFCHRLHKRLRQIPPNAKTGTLTIGQDLKQRTYAMKLGALNPVSDITGVQARLNNLGYWCGAVTGEMNDDTRDALKAFQTDSQGTIDGTASQDTQDKLAGFHEDIGGSINPNAGNASSSASV